MRKLLDTDAISPAIALAFIGCGLATALSRLAMMPEPAKMRPAIASVTTAMIVAALLFIGQHSQLTELRTHLRQVSEMESLGEVKTLLGAVLEPPKHQRKFWWQWGGFGGGALLGVALFREIVWLAVR